MVTQIRKISERVVSAFSKSDLVLGIALCGSFTDELYDDFSDVDLWVYLAEEASNRDVEDLVKSTPGNYELKNPHGGGYTLVEYIEDRTLVSVKLLKATHIDLFLARQQAMFYDEMLFEDIETMLKWKILWDRQHFLSKRTARVHEVFKKDLARLRGTAERRYGDLFWRSAYQGVYRGDDVQWAMLISAATHALVIAQSLRMGVPPPPMKWRFSKHVITRLGLEEVLRLIEFFATGKGVLKMISAYEMLRSTEDALAPALPYEQRWWWKVFDNRAQNITVQPELEDRLQQFLS